MRIIKSLTCLLLVLSLHTTADAKNRVKMTLHRPDECTIFSNTLSFIASQNEQDARSNKLFSKVPDTGLVSIRPSNKLNGTVYERFTRSANGRWIYRAVIAELPKKDAVRLDSMADVWSNKLLPCLNNSGLWQKSNMELKSTLENRKYFLDYQNTTDKSKKFWITKSCTTNACELVLMAG